MRGKLSRSVLVLNLLGVGLLCSLPHWASWLANRGDYTPFSASPQVSELVYDEGHYYATGPRRFMDTGSLAPEIDVYELRNLRSGVATLHSVVIGGAGRLLGSLEVVWVLCDVVLPPLLWLLIYVWMGAVTDFALLRIAVAWGTLLFPMGPQNALLMGWGALIQPLEITRTPQPEMSFPLLLVAAYLICRALRSYSKKNIVIAGLLAGVIFYAYYYYWLTLYLGLGALAVVCALQQKWALMRRIGSTIAIGIAAGLPYLYVASSKDGNIQLARFSTSGRHIDGLGVVFFLLVGVALFVTMRSMDDGKENRSRWAIISMLLLAVGGALGLNFQLVTGLDVMYRIHLTNRLLQPVGFLLICAWAAVWLRMRGYSRSLITRAVVVGALAPLLFIGVYRQYQVSVRTREAHRLSSPRMQTMLWIRNHLSPLEVVGTADEEMSLLLPAITSQWAFVPVRMRSMASDEEIKFRYWLFSTLIGSSREQILYVLSGEVVRAGGSGIGMARPVHSITSGNLEPKWEKKASEWEQADIRTALKQRRLDYLIAPANASPTSTERYVKVSVVYKNSDWQLWRTFPE